jgi:hypothetical protein
MSITIAVRFRPVASSNQSSAAATKEAVDRWTEQLSRHPGLLGSRFGPPDGASPMERADAVTEGGAVRPVNLVTEWESIEHANTLFDNSEPFCNLNGLVASAPAVTIKDARG